MNPFFTVIIPTFNREKTILRAVNSVLNQSFKNFELILIDDGSYDNTKNLLKDLNLIYIKQNNKGVSAARNKGIEISKGEWICFLDSDDEWLENKLQAQFDAIHSDIDIKFFHSEEIWIRNGVRVNQMKKHKKGDENLLKRSMQLCLISPSTACVHKSVLNEFNGFDEDYPCCEDYDLWLKILSKYKTRFIETPLIKKYGGHEDQLSKKYIAMDYYRVKSLSKLIKSHDLFEDLKDEAKKILLKKCEILLKGFIKYDNFIHYKEVKAIQDSHIS